MLTTDYEELTSDNNNCNICLLKKQSKSVSDDFHYNNEHDVWANYSFHEVVIDFSKGRAAVGK